MNPKKWDKAHMYECYKGVVDKDYLSAWTCDENTFAKEFMNVLDEGIDANSNYFTFDSIMVPTKQSAQLAKLTEATIATIEML